MRAFLCIIAAAAVSGVLLALALPPSDHWWLGPICIAPLLAAVARQGLMRGFVGGIICPLVTSLVIQSNLIYRVPHDRGGPSWVMVGCGFFGFLIAVVASVASETKLGGWRRVLLLSSLAVSLEFALFPILPAHLALTQYRAPGMLLLASFGGIWLVSLLMWACNVSIAESLRRKEPPNALIAVSAVAVGYFLGYLPRVHDGPTTRVGAIQTEETDSKSMTALNLDAGRRGAVLVVWPEFGGMEMAPAGDTKELKALSSEPGQPSIVTSFRDDFKPLPHNVAALFAGGLESSRYFKRKVFGGESKMHTPGTAAVAVPWSGHPNVGLNICYDACYPKIIAETAGQTNVGLVALPTIDPDATNCFIAAVHSAFTPFRAAESGVPIVRADGIAYSQIVDSRGNIVAELGPQKEGVLVGDVALEKRFTIYSILGDWALYGCLVIVLAETVLLFKNRHR